MRRFPKRGAEEPGGVGTNRKVLSSLWIPVRALPSPQLPRVGSTSKEALAIRGWSRHSFIQQTIQPYSRLRAQPYVAPWRAGPNFDWEGR